MKTILQLRLNARTTNGKREYAFLNQFGEELHGKIFSSEKDARYWFNNELKPKYLARDEPIELILK